MTALYRQQFNFENKSRIGWNGAVGLVAKAKVWWNYQLGLRPLFEQPDSFVQPRYGVAAAKHKGALAAVKLGAIFKRAPVFHRYCIAGPGHRPMPLFDNPVLQTALGGDVLRQCIWIWLD